MQYGGIGYAYSGYLPPGFECLRVVVPLTLTANGLSKGYSECHYMAIGRDRSGKGIVLTLAVVVLVVLMVAELTTYVYLNMNYQTLDALGSGAAGSYRVVGALNSTLRHSCAQAYTALGALSSYEGSGTGLYINNTAYPSARLWRMDDIQTNEVALMGGAMLSNYTNSIILQAKLQGLALRLQMGACRYPGRPLKHKRHILCGVYA